MELVCVSMRTCELLPGVLRGPSWELQDGHMNAILQQNDEPRDCTVGMGTMGTFQSHSWVPSLNGMMSPRTAQWA